MAHLTLGDLLAYLDALERAYGLDVPLWLVHPAADGTRDLEPCTDMRLTLTGDAPALLLLGASAGLEEKPTPDDDLLADLPPRRRRYV